MRAVSLGDALSLDAAAVGHKAANLARFAATFRVPPAFCLATTVYDELRGALDGDRAARVELARIVAEAYERLARAIGADGPRVAVRSSATGEDGADASFAGQHETILNVAGAEAVTAAVLDCWRSAASERVTAYREAKGIAGPVSVAVLVQQMVDADVSAIAFGVDPVSGDRDVIVVDAAPGLGDRIASGEITPDRYVVRKADLVVSGPVHGALDDESARAVAKLVLALERENGHEVDVECAFANGALHLLQCRPVTTLGEDFPVVWREAGDESLFWRRDDAHFAGPIPHLVIDYIQQAAAHGMRVRNERYQTGLRSRFEAFNGRQYIAAQPLVPLDEVAARAKANLAARRAQARALGRVWREEYLPRLREHFAWMRSHDIPRMSFDELVALLDSFWPRLNEIWEMHMMTTGGSYFLMDELAATFERLTGGSALDAYRLTQGRAHSLQQLERDLHALAVEATRRPRAAHALRGTSSVDEVRAADAELATSIERFLAAHGSLGHAGEDMRHLPWSDEPAPLFAEIARRVDSPTEDPEVRLARLIAEGDAVEARAREQLRDLPEALAELLEIIAAARDAGPLTEEHNYHLDRQVQAHSARIFMGIGRRLADVERLPTAEDVYFLHPAEVRDALAGRDQRALVAERGAEFARWQRLRAPKTLGTPPATPLGPVAPRADLFFRAPQDDERVVRGVPASAGVRRGRVRIVRGTADFPRMTKGDVLVCRSSNVSWIPLFTLAAAVVTDIGGALSHAAVVAREFGVPAVVGCNVAMERLRDGQLVEVDGEAGLVRPLD